MTGQGVTNQGVTNETRSRAGVTGRAAPRPTRMHAGPFPYAIDPANIVLRGIVSASSPSHHLSCIC